jgi:ABC-2 type transport system permease protein
MRTWLIVRKSLLEMWHEPQIPLAQVLLPLLFLLIFWSAFSAPLRTAQVVLVMASDSRAEPLIEHLRAQRYSDGKPVFDLRTVTLRDEAEAAIKNHSASVLVNISTDSTGALAISMRGDATWMSFITASTFLGNVLSPYLDATRGIPQVVRFDERPLYALGPKTQFDTFAPGIIIFAIMLLGPQAAIFLTREARWGTLRRLRLTPLRAWELLSGVTLAQMIVAVAMVIVLLAAMRALSIYNQGSWLLSIGIGVLLSFSSIGFGLITACFAHNDFDAYNIAAVLVMPQVFMSGAFFPLPPMTVFSLAGHPIGAFDFLPATHGMLALRQVFIGGAALNEIAFRLGMTAVLSVLYFALGVFVFERMQMRHSG